MSDSFLSAKQESDDGFKALLNNANAARAISQVVEGTIGPRGLDVMLVDKFGDVVISNDGVTILKLMEVSHPAAQMIINAVKTQQAEVGDGTTTTAIVAGALVTEGSAQVLKGVPVTKVVEGINLGIKRAIELLGQQSRKVESLEDSRLFYAACVAGRGNEDLARLVLEAAKLIGAEKMMKPDFKFTSAVIARELAKNEVFNGVLLNREPVNREMPYLLENAVILAIDDALAPEELDREAIKTESGFKYYLEAREKYEENLNKICDLGVNLIAVDRSIDDTAEEIFTRRGVMAMQRVSTRELDRLCKNTGARKIKRNSLNRSQEVIKQHLGRASKASFDEKHQYVCVEGGQGGKWATIIIGASTEELLDERERMAKDAASAVQAALQGGLVPGGGAMEIWMANQLENLAKEHKGLASFGVLCVKEALIKPFLCMAANAGFNPLEKLGDVIAGQKKAGADSLSFSCHHDGLIDMVKSGIVDPAPVKIHALKAAGEVAAAILRINTIIKMKAENDDAGI